ncbi:DUF1800 domain-containing protein [Zavarzinia aquatilis]|nr:DUF1800 domain-containing protein [Zavarzinia aquatilis]
MSRDAFIAANRFGLGARPGELSALAGDPRGALLEQLKATPVPTDLPDTAGALEIAGSRRAMTAGTTMDANDDGRPDNPIRDLYLREVTARFARCVASTAPLRDRLVLFWSNHFTVSVARSGVVPLAGVFEREAIAPHVTGRFADLLTAATLHPAMLTYLDQYRSIGPDSKIGQRKDVGLNENLGREVLELHTLGVDGGYGQDDVIALARILTGWTATTDKGGVAKRFGFDPNRHQPGDKMLVGTKIKEGGEQETHDALAMLARHPSTAKHLATKLVRHFVADDPPAAAVDHIASVYLQSDGDLAAVTRAVIALDSAWTDPLAKMKTPWELAVAMARALGGDGLMVDGPALFRRLRSLGQPPFGAPSPAGWPDRAPDWLGPDALMRRIDLGADIAGKQAGGTDLASLIDATIAPLLSPSKAQFIKGAGDRASGVAMVFASPEFQQR